VTGLKKVPAQAGLWRAVTKQMHSYICLLAVGASLASSQHSDNFRLLAGGSQGASDGIGTHAKFAMTGDADFELGGPSDTLYVVDTGGNTVRALAVSTGAVATVAGSSAGILDGFGTSAKFDTPWGVAITGATLYVTDTGNNVLRAINVVSKAVTTIVGDGTQGVTDGTLLGGAITSPYGVALDSSGTLVYLACSGGGYNALRFANLGTDTLGTLMSSTDESYGTFKGLAHVLKSDSTPALYIADTFHHQLLVVDCYIDTEANDVVLVAGGERGHADGVAESARFNLPSNVAYSASLDLLYVADRGNDAIRVVSLSTHEVTTMPGYISDPMGMAIKGDSLYVLNEFAVLAAQAAPSTVPTARVWEPTIAPTSTANDGSSSSVSALSSLPENVALFVVLGMVLGAAGLVKSASAFSAYMMSKELEHEEVEMALPAITLRKAKVCSNFSDFSQRDKQVTGTTERSVGYCTAEPVDDDSDNDDSNNDHHRSRPDAAAQVAVELITAMHDLVATYEQR